VTEIAEARDREVAAPEEAAVPTGPPPELDRYRFLEPYLDALSQVLEITAEEDADNDLLMTFGGAQVTISAWAREVSCSSFASAEARETTGWRVAESVALIGKIREDLALVAEGRSTSAAELAGQQLLFDAALGAALLTELQKVLDALVVNGRMSEAKQLTRFWHQLGRTVADAKAQLPEGELPNVSALAECLVAPPIDAALPEIKPRRRRRPRPMTDAEEQTAAYTTPDPVFPVHEPRKARRLVLLLVALVALWFGLSVPRLYQEKMRTFTEDDFHQHEAIEAVVARPPALYVTIDANVWSGLDERSRVALIDGIAFSIKREGYTGARFATPDGITVAQWLRARGVQLTDSQQ
jgi:hypothetical protein